MAKLIVTKEIEDELDALDLTQPDLVDAAELLLQSLYEDLDLLARLHVPDTYPLRTPVFEVKLFIEAYRNGLNIYSLKFQELDGFLADHRIFLGFNSRRDVYYALAITHRQYAFDTGHPAYRNLCARYDKYAIPRLS